MGWVWIRSLIQLRISYLFWSESKSNFREDALQWDFDVDSLTGLWCVCGLDVCTREGECGCVWWRFRTQMSRVDLCCSELNSASSWSEKLLHWPLWWQTESLTLERGVIISSNWLGRFKRWPEWPCWFSLTWFPLRGSVWTGVRMERVTSEAHQYCHGKHLKDLAWSVLNCGGHGWVGDHSSCDDQILPDDFWL